MKKNFAKFLLLILFLNFFCITIAADEVFQGHIEQTDKIIPPSELYTGKVETLEKKDILRMTVSQVIDGAYSVEGDEFFAEVTDDVEGDNGIIIPSGTVAHGKIRASREARRLGRDGYIDLDFDYLITPDGREIPIEGKMSTKLHPLVAGTKIVATDLGYTAAGGVIGGFFALNMFGIEAAIASQGYTIAGGAAVGGLIGLGASLHRKGKDVLIAPGDEIRVKINTAMELPVYKKTAFKHEEVLYDGLDVRISNIAYEKDPFGELNTITLTLAISNMTKKNFSSFDIALVNENGNIFHPSVFGDTGIMMKQIKPGDRIAGRISFSVNNVKKEHWLTFFDRKTRKPLAQISVKNAYVNVSDKTKKKNQKQFKKKNYYKDTTFDFE